MKLNTTLMLSHLISRVKSELRLDRVNTGNHHYEHQCLSFSPLTIYPAISHTHFYGVLVPVDSHFDLMSWYSHLGERRPFDVIFLPEAVQLSVFVMITYNIAKVSISDSLDNDRLVWQKQFCRLLICTSISKTRRFPILWCTFWQNESVAFPILAKAGLYTNKYCLSLQIWGLKLIWSEKELIF